MHLPATLARRTLVANGLAQSFVEAGAEDGPPLVLIHGLGWDAERLWRPLMADLSGEGWHLVAPDMRGVGHSAPLDRPYSIAAYAGDLLALIDDLGIERCTLVGFSMGGMVATAMAHALGPRCAGLAFCCAGLASSPASEAGVEAMLARATDLGPDAFAAEQAQAIFHPAWAQAHPQAVDDFRRWRAAMDQTGLAHAFRAPKGCDLRDAFAALTCPVATLFGADDAFIPLDAARATAALHPAATLDIMPDCGHMAPIEQPGAFAALIRAFLARSSFGDASPAMAGSA